ncbi:DUF1295 domain-containing protein [Candidatus Bipolaricaulota bacterium]|nr:DUF1295 domain-containing protein [Candidatus Bipolaricaulota bacterium]
MNRSERNALLAMPFVLLAAAGLSWAGSQRGSLTAGVPVFAVASGLAFIMQWIALVPAFVLRSERFFDLTGSITYIAVAATAVALSANVDARALLLLGLVVIWATRLGSFLLRRVRKTGKDKRFDEIKRSFPRFLMTWTLQGLWVSVTLAAALAAMTTTIHRPLGLYAWVGLAIWLVGFGVEASADEQKRRFRSDPANRGGFIQSGLWSWSRHPNYFGEIVLWIGIAIIAAPVLRGFQWATMISPVFVTLLLTRISGIPMLEKRADTKWGDQPEYLAYKRRTSVLIPRPPRG